MANDGREDTLIATVDNETPIGVEDEMLIKP